MAKSETPLFFATPAELCAWMKRNHASATEQWVGFYKKDSGRPSVTWPEAVDEALCVGWIDGVRKGIDEVSYKIRFTPRKRGSTWSAVNIKRVAELTREKRMRAPGLEAFSRRVETKSRIYAYEQLKAATFDGAAENKFRANKEAWTYFEAQPPGYRQLATWWVTSAKKEETRAKRLAKVISDSAAGRRI